MYYITYLSICHPLPLQHNTSIYLGFFHFQSPEPFQASKLPFFFFLGEIFDGKRSSRFGEALRTVRSIPQEPDQHNHPRLRLADLLHVCFDVTAGSLGALLLGVCWVGSSVVGSTLGFSLAWKVVAVSQFVCWSTQFVGHGIFEKRAPAFLDNLVQAFLMAPLFVLLEILWKLFGYEPYPGFNASVQTMIQSNISEWQTMKEKKCS